MRGGPEAEAYDRRMSIHPIAESPFQREPSAELPVTWPRVVRVWWAIAWRSFLAIPLGGAVGCVIGFVLGFLGHFMGVGPSQVQWAIRLVTIPIGLILGVAVGLWATRAVLRKTFQDFRIALLSR
jgi:hypothetical protein